MLTPNGARAAVPALSLDFHAQGLRLDPQDRGPALEQRRVHVRRAQQRVVARPQARRPVQPQHVPGNHAVHVERQAHAVAFCDEVRAPVHVYCCVVRGLRAQEREELGDGGGGYGVWCCCCFLV